MDEEIRSLLENGTWEARQETGGGEVGTHEVGLHDQEGCAREREAVQFPVGGEGILAEAGD